ncbi:D-cysteine desulfhydrase [Anaeroselena agilis]|uniref:D-cysteine desulfhydrase n=1 Tax=Anaeroselena agilis TaxID=3063788 RepID=A0ABU3P4Y4_9FIRM|nr:D-cysteine desulfhydrase [Selenomonadales bacterium 4137-cl]
MNLDQFPRRRYTEGRTPIEFLPNFSRAVGGPEIYVKRDDLLGLTGGGNKTRKLEFLVGDALAKGADTLITCGAVQSNHCRLTLAAAVKEGLKCRLILAEATPGAYRPDAGGNVFLYHLLGVERITVVPWGTDLLAALAAAEAEAAAEGRRPYVIPLGGSNPIGALGYVACGQEIAAQCAEGGLEFDNIVVAGGSAGTQGGLLLGLRSEGCGVPVTGISVLNPREVQQKLVYEMAEKTAGHIGAAVPVKREEIAVYDDYLGPGYTLPTAAMVEAVKLLASTEGILLDPSYTGKAMAGLIDLARKGVFPAGGRVLFIHTGGWPALFAHQELFLDK